jgi:hypothetical protein
MLDAGMHGIWVPSIAPKAYYNKYARQITLQ